MADTDIVQVIAEARADAKSLSEFVFKPADFMVQRRLAPPINTLQFYIDYFSSLESVFSSSVASANTKLDAAVTAAENKTTYIDAVISGAINESILSSGFIVVDSFELGATITQRNQALRHTATGNLYRWAGDLPKVVTASSTPTSSGGFGNNAWLEVSDITLRQDLASPQKWKDTIKGLPFVTPEMYGAKGDGVTVDSEALIATFAAAGAGSVIHLTPNKTYTVDRTIPMLAKQTLIGNKASLKRVNQVVTTTTAAMTAASMSVTVASVEGLKVDQIVSFAKAGVARDKVVITSTMSNPRRIASISGNTVTLTSAVGIALPINSTMFLAFSTIAMSDSCIVANTVFDGNKDNWSYNRWEVISEIDMISGSSNNSGLQILNNLFINSPSEGILARSKNSVIHQNEFRDINGNTVHTSNARNLVISENTGNNGNMDMAVGHQDGFVSISQQNHRIIIRDNIASNFLSGVAPVSVGNSNISVIDNQFYDMYSFGITGGTCPNTIISGNRLHNIPTDKTKQPAYTYHEPLVLNGAGTGNLIVTNNVVTGVVGDNYAVRISGAYTDTTLRSLISGNTFEGLAIIGGHGIDFTDNKVSALTRIVDIANSSITKNNFSGLLFSASNSITDFDLCDNTIDGGSAGMSLGATIVHKNIKIDGNKFINQINRGIGVESSTRVANGLTVSNNTVFAGDSASTAFVGILIAMEGVTASGNKVHAGKPMTTTSAIILGMAGKDYKNLLAVNNEVRGDWKYTMNINLTATGIYALNNVLEAKDITGTPTNLAPNTLVFNAPAIQKCIQTTH